MRVRCRSILMTHEHLMRFSVQHARESANALVNAWYLVGCGSSQKGTGSPSDGQGGGDHCSVSKFQSRPCRSTASPYFHMEFPPCFPPIRPMIQLRYRELPIGSVQHQSAEIRRARRHAGGVALHRTGRHHRMDATAAPGQIIRTDPADGRPWTHPADRDDAGPQQRSHVGRAQPATRIGWLRLAHRALLSWGAWIAICLFAAAVPLVRKCTAETESLRR